MIRVMIHTPVNLRGRILDYFKDSLDSLEARAGDKIKLYTPHDPEYALDCSEEWLAPAVVKDIVPDVMITHAAEFAFLENRAESRLASTIAGEYAGENPLKNEIAAITDPSGLFYPLFVIPLVMLYNPQNIDENELNHSWSDLLNEKYRVIFPDRDKPLSRAVGGYLKREFPDKFDEFEKRVTYSGTPANVVKEIISGEYDIAVTNITFAAVAAAKGAVINYPTEGFVLLPDIIAFKNGADERLKIFADFMMSEKIQNYLSEQGVWTAISNDSFEHSEMMKNWQGWDSYLKDIAEFDKHLPALKGEDNA